MTARLLKNESLIKKLELSLQFKGMEKLKDLSERFQDFLSRTFPGFSDLSLTNIAVLNGLEDKITKRRPLVNFQIVNSSSDQLVGQIDQTSLDMPDTQLAVVLENAKTILSFKQKVLEANLSNYTKFSSVAQVSFFFPRLKGSRLTL